MQQPLAITLSQYAVVAMIGLIAVGLALLAAALWWHAPDRPNPPMGWKNYRIGYPVYALIFLSFDMEMIFMYPWAVVFAQEGAKAFMDMLVFIALLSAGIAYAWGMGGFKWE